MGATFCNLYCRDEQANALKSKLAAEDRVLHGFNGWCMALAEDRNPERMMSVAKKVSGDVIVFFCFDDDYFELTLFHDGKKPANVNSTGTGSKLSVLAGLLPSDPKALKKLRAIKDCVSIEESMYLLEETFGLPFFALHEQEKVCAVPINDNTWNTVTARIEAFKKRPNRFQIQTLTSAEWPDSTKIRMSIINQSRDQGLSGTITGLFYDLPDQLFSQAGCPSRILLPMYIPQHGERSYSGYNTIIALDFKQHETKTYSFAFSVGRPLLVNSSKAMICENYKQNYLLCQDDQGNEQWRFAPELVRPLLKPVRTNREEIVILCTDYGSSSTADRIWRISPDNGQILNERILTEHEEATALRGVTDMGCFMYYTLNSNSVVLLDNDFSEIRRFQFEEKRVRFDSGFLSGHNAYTSVPRRDGTNDLLSLDLLSGKLCKIHPEIPAYINRKLSCGVFVGFSADNMGTLNLLDKDGKVVSRHRFSDALMGIWEENGNVYGATTMRTRFPGFWEDSIIDSVSVFRLADSLDTN